MVLNKNLIVIGGRINYYSKFVRGLLENRDFGEIKRIALEQAEEGADYINVNVGLLPVEVMERVVKAVQEVVDKPLCIDSDDPLKLKAGLEAYDPDIERGMLPLLNSATEARASSVFSLKRVKDCCVVLLISERFESGSLKPNMSTEELYETAKRLFIKAVRYGFKPEELFADLGLYPLAVDEEGMVNVVLETMEKIKKNQQMNRMHLMVGLTNLTKGLPSKEDIDRDIKTPLQKAFLRIGLEKGLDTVIWNPASRKVEYDEETKKFYLDKLEEILNLKGIKKIKKVKELYA
ncbi:MAG: dihydropteroate synthase [Candidatus Hodarchaeota archaeon]